MSSRSLRSLDHQATSELAKKAKVRLKRFDGGSIPAPMLAKVLALVELNMKGFYGASWNSAEKLKELSHPEMCLLVRCCGLKLHAMIAFRIEYEMTVKIAYIYEIQVAEEARGDGWGSQLIEEVERSGRSAGACGIMLTVHKRNKRAIHFYMSRQGFEISPISPSRCAPPTLLHTCDYEVMQLIWNMEAKQKLIEQGDTARRQLYVEALEEGSLRIRLTMSRSSVTGKRRRTSDSVAHRM